MAQYRKKPVVIEAVRASELHHQAGHDFWAMPKWIIDAYDRCDVLFFNHPSCIVIKTLEGDMTANMDDMVIQGVQGEIYPCKPDIFEQTYEVVENA